MCPKKIKADTAPITDEAPAEQEEDVQEEQKPVEPVEPEEKPVQPAGIYDQPGELVVDVFETNADFVVLAAIAGVQIKDIDISLEKDMMVIKGNRGDPHDHPGKKYFYQECYWGPFSRKVILPENIDRDKADAQMDKGVLTIKIPKNETPATKIGVKVS